MDLKYKQIMRQMTALQRTVKEYECEIKKMETKCIKGIGEYTYVLTMLDITVCP